SPYRTLFRSSAVTRAAALLALLPSLTRRISSARARSPAASVSAFLHSIMGASVFSRSSLTMVAVIWATIFSSSVKHAPGGTGAGSKHLPAPCQSGAEDRTIPRDRLLAFFVGFFDLDEFLAFSEFFDDTVEGLLAAFQHGIRHAARIQRDRTSRVIVAGDHVVNAFGRVVGIDDRHNGDAQSASFGNGNLVVADVDHEQCVGQIVHVLDAADGLVELVEFALEHQTFFLAHALGQAFCLLRFHFLEALDGGLDRLEVGHHAAEPAAVDVGHAATLGFLSDEFTSSALRADEQHLAATSSQLTQVFLRFQVLDDALFEVYDVDLVTLTEDEGRHLRVPVTGLMAEVNSGFQHFTHQRHNILQGLGPISGASNPLGGHPGAHGRPIKASIIDS